MIKISQTELSDNDLEVPAYCVTGNDYPVAIPCKGNSAKLIDSRMVIADFSRTSASAGFVMVCRDGINRLEPATNQKALAVITWASRDGDWEEVGYGLLEAEVLGNE